MYVDNGWLYQLLGGNGDILVYNIESDGSLSLLQSFDGGLPCGTPAAALPVALQNHSNTGPLERPSRLARGYFATTNDPDILSSNGKPKGVYPLGECQGGCDKDEECGEEGLICFHRDRAMGASGVRAASLAIRTTG
jgi:hypothetical protein